MGCIFSENLKSLCAEYFGPDGEEQQHDHADYDRTQRRESVWDPGSLYNVETAPSLGIRNISRFDRRRPLRHGLRYRGGRRGRLINRQQIGSRGVGFKSLRVKKTKESRDNNNEEETEFDASKSQDLTNIK